MGMLYVELWLANRRTIMGTPKSVQEEADKAGEQLNALFNARDSQDTENVSPEKPPEIVEKAENVATEKAIHASSEQKQTPENKDDNNVWHERWKQINGKYLAEVPRYASEVKALKDEIRGFKTQISDLEAINKRLTDQLGNNTQGLNPNSIPASLNDTLGEEASRSVVSFLENRIRQLEGMIEGKIKPVEKNVESLRETQVLTEKQRYVSDLDSLSPSWRLRDSDPEFNKWLDSNIESLSGNSFRQLLIDADSKMDASRVSRIINAYEKDLKGTANTTIQNADRKQELGKMVVPGNSNASVVKPEGNKPETFSMKTVEKFYDDIKHGKFKGSNEDKNRLDVVYQKAIYENRITP